jgi:hypothetical protein
MVDHEQRISLCSAHRAHFGYVRIDGEEVRLTAQCQN